MSKKELMYKTAGKKLADKIIEVFGDTGENWYYLPWKALGNKTPYEFCRQEKFSEVEDVLIRIEHGVFS